MVRDTRMRLRLLRSVAKQMPLRGAFFACTSLAELRPPVWRTTSSLHFIQDHQKRRPMAVILDGAGYENRTRTSCLGSIRTTTILIPPNNILALAEREGFEPSMGFTPYTISSRAPSAARPPLQCTWSHLRDSNPGPQLYESCALAN